MKIMNMKSVIRVQRYKKNCNLSMKNAIEGMKNMTKICKMYLGLKKCNKSISYENYNMGKNNVIMIK